MTALLIVAAALGLGPGRAVDFDTEVVPVLTRAGCNAGACHGAAIGRGGFRLSLLGGDPGLDYESIVHELEGRRVNLARPDRSLLLAKPTGGIEHGGGIQMPPDGPAVERLSRWIAEGATRSGVRRLVRLDVEPNRRVVERIGAEVPVRVVARFDDGAVEGVTRWTVLTPADPSAVAIERSGDRATATVGRAGPNLVLARFLDRVVPIELVVPMSGRPVDLGGETRRNVIDEMVLDTLATLRIPPSPPADDATFLRRARLDLTGRLPTPEEVRVFLADPAPDRRDGLVDRLLRSDEFSDYWAFRLATRLRVRSVGGDPEVARVFHGWLREQVGRGTPFDAMARALLTAEGDSHESGPANFHRVVDGARAQAEYVGRAFMGVGIGCANCHNHPLDRWTQDDYHGLAAVFARMERGRVVRELSRGEVTHPRTGEPAVPRIPGGPALDPDGDPRRELADWLTDGENPYFARAAVNWLWAAMFGRGLVEPVDDMRATNPATHPELLDALAADFIAHGHDLRYTLRLIASSATYGRGGGTDANRGDDRFYAFAPARPLAAEVLADALADVTGVRDRYGDLPEGTRAVALADPAAPAESLDILGRCPRNASCTAPGGDGGGLPATLHRLNGPLINRKLDDPTGRLARLCSEGRSEWSIVEEFYLRALGRPPTVPERSFWLAEVGGVADADERGAILGDIAWGLLNCREFRTNH